MAELTPLQVQIGLKVTGGRLFHDFPDFNTLAVVIASGLDWSVYVDKEGASWFYDTCGHADEEPGSPRGTWLGVLLAPDAFATQAVAAFPTLTTILTEAAWEIFYDTKHAKEAPDEDIDVEIVKGLESKTALGQPLTANQVKALDPADDAPGIRKNKNKAWADFKVRTGITITK